MPQFLQAKQIIAPTQTLLLTLDVDHLKSLSIKSHLHLYASFKNFLLYLEDCTLRICERTDGLD